MPLLERKSIELSEKMNVPVAVVSTSGGHPSDSRGLVLVCYDEITNVHTEFGSYRKKNVSVRGFIGSKQISIENILLSDRGIALFVKRKINRQV